MNRNKKDKIILIIVLSAFGLILFSCVVVVPIIVGLIKEDNINKKIYNSLCNFDHSSNVVYYDDNYIYYNGDIAKFDNMDVLWIDETNIFYYDSTKKIYILDMGSNRVLLSKNFKGYSKTIFVRNNIIYSKYISNTFYKYDILSCDSTQISNEEYYFMRDESKYSVSISTLDVKIINNETNDNINISKDNMSREDSFSSIYNFNCFIHGSFTHCKVYGTTHTM